MKLHDFSLLRSYASSQILTEEDRLSATILGRPFERLDKFSQDRVHSKEGLGGYWYPILQGEESIHLANNFDVCTFHPPKTKKQHRDLLGLLNRPDVCFAYVKSGSLHITFADFTLADRGLDVGFRADEFNDDGKLIAASDFKTVKRLSTVDRMVRVHWYGSELNVLIVDFDPEWGGVELDGATSVGRHIIHEGISRAQMGFWSPSQEASMRNRLDKEKVFNGRFVGGAHINVETGEEIPGFIKFNCTVRDDMPVINGRRVDIITSTENIKKEITGSGGVWGVFEPQGAKKAYEDQQHLMNNPFLMPAGEVKERMHTTGQAHLGKLQDGEALDSVENLLAPEQNVKYSWDATRYTRMYRWVGSNLRLHFPQGSLPEGMFPEHWSPWFSYQIGRSWVSACGLTNPKRWQKTARIPIPHAVRAQVMSQAFINRIHGDEDFHVDDEEIRYHEETGTYVVSTSDWCNIVVDSHGGCDMDDFFVLRWVNDGGELRVIATRNPLTRGEYSIWKPHTGDPIPDDTGSDYDIQFPKVRPGRPLQILDAQERGKVKILKLPSAQLPKSTQKVRGYYKEDVRKDLSAVMMADDSNYGSIELAVRLWNSQHARKHHPKQYGSEDMVDAFTQAGALEDQKVALQYGEQLIEEVKDSGKPCDPYLVGDETLGLKNRLGVEDLISDKTGPMYEIKTEMLERINWFIERLTDFTQNLPTPEFIKHFWGNQKIWTECQTMLKKTRNQQARDYEAGSKDSRKNQEKIIIPWLKKIRETRGEQIWAEYVLTLWAVTLATPKSDADQTITDQLIFGTSVHEHWFEAMRYYGFALHPDVSDEGQIIYLDRDIEYDFTANQWIGTCQSCGETYELSNLKRFYRFKQMQGICTTCRKSQVS